MFARRFLFVSAGLLCLGVEDATAQIDSAVAGTVQLDACGE